MSDKTNFGDTLTNGIQDVSALLPLLGTEQCERHVGSALEKGFLYAAVTPLSIFGSLGVVKTAFATLLATITFPFYGGRWLNDAGFGTPGSVSSMVTIAKGGVEYGAEVNLVKLLEDQHIDDVDLVADVEWSGWQMTANSPSAWWMSMSWNMKLVLTSALAALISISPYLYLISSDWSDPLFWFFPFLRAFGSFLCVVAIQLALQLRIHYIIRGRLLLMKATKFWLKGDGKGHSVAVKRDILEQRLRKLSIDPEKAVAGKNSITQDLSSVLTTDWVLVTYQLIMAIGIPMIVVGYVGCFNLVSQSTVVGGPYVWLGTEAVLSVIRLALWGWNPEWDEGTGMNIKLKLSDDTPLVTTPYSLGELDKWSRNYSFIICNENDFLATATRYTGPLQRFVSSTVVLFYSLVADERCQSKRLLTTILDLHTRTTQTFYIDTAGISKVFSSTWKLDPRTNAMRVTLGDEIKRNESHRDDVFNQVLNHSKQTASRLCGNGRIHALDLQWTVSYSSPKSDLSVSEMAMNDGDRTYAGVGNQFSNKHWFCQQRAGGIRDYMDKWEASWSPNEWTELGQRIEVLHILENAVLEMYLCSKDQILAQELVKTDRELAHRLSAEWVHEMECRMSEEKESAMRRLDEWKLHDNVKQRIIELWKRAPENLEEHVDRRLAKITEILDIEDMRKLISTIFPPAYSDYWPSNSPSECVQRALDSQVKWFVRRLKMVLLGGIQHDPWAKSRFVSFNFAEDPYLWIQLHDTSTHVLDAIRLNSSLRVIQLPDNLSTSDNNKILEIMADKDSLTTLIGSNRLSLVLSADILRNNHHILFLPTMTCSQPCIEQHPFCALVRRNRQEWRDRACSASSDVTYAVGLSSSSSSSSGATLHGIYLDGDEIMLQPAAECFIMVYTQSNGHFKLSLHHRRNWRDLSLHIFLRSGEIASATKWKEVCYISRADIPERHTNKPHEIIIPEELSAGYHEIRIQIEGHDYHLHSAAVTRCEGGAN